MRAENIDPYKDFPGVQKAIRRGDMRPLNKEERKELKKAIDESDYESKKDIDEISEEALNSPPNKDEISLE